MPHVLLEYSDNVADRPDVTSLLGEINRHLAGTGLFALDAIKSRAICHDTYAVGDGAPRRAFVALQLTLFEGRDDATKALLSDGLVQLLEPHFARSLSEMACDITVRIAEMHRASYRKRSGPR